jgi:site-specific recombinase XerD
MITDLDELIQLCKDELHDREYHAYHARILTTEWSAISYWFEKHAIREFNQKMAFSYCDEMIGSYLITKEMNRKQKKRLRAVRMLLSYQETGDFEFRSPSVEYTFPGDTGEIILRYLQYEKDRGRSESTIRCKRMALCQFNRYLTQDELGFDDLGVDEIEKYFSLICGESLSLRHNNANHLRQLFHYLYEFRITKKDHALFVLKDQYRNRCKVPTTYNEEEISQIIASVDRSSPVGKRDYLILLLAAQYGWRAGDIVSFKFDQIDWKKNTIAFEQSKTDVPVEFPLLASVGNAIIDYLKYGRPDSKAPEVIVAAQGSTKGGKLTSPTIHSIVSKYMLAAHISHWKEKKHGPHSLRHSLASNLLKKNVSMPVISTVLGHQRTETTKIYLKVDIDSLGRCALPIPPLSSSLYGEVSGL